MTLKNCPVNCNLSRDINDRMDGVYNRINNEDEIVTYDEISNSTANLFID